MNHVLGRRDILRKSAKPGKGSAALVPRGRTKEVTEMVVKKEENKGGPS